MAGLDALSAAERSVVLAELLRGRPEFRAVAGALAAGLLRAGDVGQIAAGVAAELRALRIGELAGRAGRRRGGGYAEPRVAAAEMLAGGGAPDLVDLARRGRL